MDIVFIIQVNYKYYIYFFLEKFFQSTNFFININREDYLITKKI